jgi:hypothetical protein
MNSRPFAAEWEIIRGEAAMLPPGFARVGTKLLDRIGHLREYDRHCVGDFANHATLANEESANSLKSQRHIGVPRRTSKSSSNMAISLFRLIMSSGSLSSVWILSREFLEDLQ